MWRGAAQTEVLSASVDAVRIRPCARATARGREPRRGKRAQKRPVSASARERSSGSACRDDAERVGDAGGRLLCVGQTPDTLRPVAGGRWPVAGGRWPVAGGRWPVAGGRWPVAGGRWPVAGGRWPVAGGRWPVANYTRVCREPLSSAGSQAVGTGRSRGQSGSQGIVNVPCAAADAVTSEYSQHGGPSPRLRAQTRCSPRLRHDRAQRPSPEPFIVSGCHTATPNASLCVNLSYD